MTVQETKEAHALEVAQHCRNFDELKATVALRQALPRPAPKPPAAPLEMTVTERGKKSKKPPV